MVLFGMTSSSPAGYQPMFGVKKPQSQSISAPVAEQPYEKQLRIGLQDTRVDIFDAFRRKKEARIVLIPAEGKFSFTPELARLDSVSAMKAWKGMQSLLEAVIGGQSKDALGNFLAIFKPEKAGEKASGEETKLKALSAMRNALEAQLNQLPAQVEKVTVVLPEKLPRGLSQQAVIQALSEQATLNSYNPNTFRNEAHPRKWDAIEFVRPGASPFQLSKSVKEGQILGTAQNLTRFLVDSPANLKTTYRIGELAKKLASPTMAVHVRDQQWIESANGRKMGLFLSVAQGNDPASFEKQPRMVEMVYTPPGGKYDKTIVLAGKGIIFDTGGNNLKPSEYIHNMQGDMAGAAAVIGAMKAIDDLKLPNVRVVAVAPLTENRLGAEATLPHDIYTARNGKTVAIENTDAEGRLVLADAADYALETYKPDALVHIATLTGGKVRGLGAQNAIALMGNNPDLVKSLDGIAKGLGRNTATLPITQGHLNWVTRGSQGKAHAYNSVPMSIAQQFGVINEEFDRGNKLHSLQHSAQGGAFLLWNVKEGNGNAKTPVAHLDIAGAEYDKPDNARGGEEFATGIGVQELVGFAQGVSSGSIVPKASKTTL
jgi:leucyl aminopeptidase